MMLRNVATAVASVLSLAVAGAYVATPTQSVLAIGVRSVAAPLVPAGHEMIYGSARDAAGRPMVGVKIVVGRSTRTGLTPLLSFRSAAAGTLRKVVALPAGRYVIKVTWTRGGATLTVTKKISLRPGNAYFLTIRALHSGGLLVLPVRGY